MRMPGHPEWIELLKHEVEDIAMEEAEARGLDVTTEDGKLRAILLVLGKTDLVQRAAKRIFGRLGL